MRSAPSSSQADQADLAAVAGTLADNKPPCTYTELQRDYEGTQSDPTEQQGDKVALLIPPKPYTPQRAFKPITATSLSPKLLNPEA